MPNLRKAAVGATRRLASCLRDGPLPTRLRQRSQFAHGDGAQYLRCLTHNPLGSINGPRGDGLVNLLHEAHGLSEGDDDLDVAA